jgi:hypothetical protein
LGSDTSAVADSPPADPTGVDLVPLTDNAHRSSRGILLLTLFGSVAS